jgi:hypothetical protein
MFCSDSPAQRRARLYRGLAELEARGIIGPDDVQVWRPGDGWTRYSVAGRAYTLAEAESMLAGARLVLMAQHRAELQAETDRATRRRRREAADARRVVRRMWPAALAAAEAGDHGAALQAAARELAASRAASVARIIAATMRAADGAAARSAAAAAAS